MHLLRNAIFRSVNDVIEIKICLKIAQEDTYSAPPPVFIEIKYKGHRSYGMRRLDGGLMFADVSKGVCVLHIQGLMILGNLQFRTMLTGSFETSGGKTYPKKKNGVT